MSLNVTEFEDNTLRELEGSSGSHLGELEPGEEAQKQRMKPPSVFTVEDIMRYLPHRYPMLLIDRLEKISPGESAVGIKNVTINEQFFQGHFPGKPVMPGVLIVEALAQSAAVLVMYSLGRDAREYVVYFMSLTDTKFRKPVTPGDTLHLCVQKQKARGDIWTFKGRAMVGEQTVAEATYTAKIALRVPEQALQ